MPHKTRAHLVISLSLAMAGVFFAICGSTLVHYIVVGNAMSSLEPNDASIADTISLFETGFSVTCIIYAVGLGTAGIALLWAFFTCVYWLVGLLVGVQYNHDV